MMLRSTVSTYFTYRTLNSNRTLRPSESDRNQVMGPVLVCLPQTLTACGIRNLVLRVLVTSTRSTTVLHVRLPVVQ